jgi:hypothetical protein
MIIISRFFNSIRRKDEKGAALVTVVLLLMLLMVACGAIILITTLSGVSSVDAVIEKQAQQAAEAGMQKAINLLRGNGTGEPISFRDAALRIRSNKGDDWAPHPRLSNWLNYNYPASQPDRVTLTPGYTPYNGQAFSVSIEAPDAIPSVVPTPNPEWVDGPVIKPDPPVKPDKPAWHPWNCSHCSWDYTHCSLYNPPNSGTFRNDGTGCRHKHCIPPANWGGADDGYQRLIIKVTGYGPRGARKELELMVKRVIVDYEAEPLVYIQGTSSGSPLSFNISGTPEVKFDSSSKVSFIITNEIDATALQNAIDGASSEDDAAFDKVKTDGKGDEYEVINLSDRPKWLTSPAETRAVVGDLEDDAKIRGRWFNAYPTGNAGTDSVPQFTFVRGDAELNSDGVGLLVVTGKLTINNNFKYKGLILLLGEGRLDVTGGDSKIEGAILLARFGLTTVDYLPPAINLSGGKMEAKYSADKVEDARNLINLRVVAVREH